MEKCKKLPKNVCKVSEKDAPGLFLQLASLPAVRLGDAAPSVALAEVDCGVAVAWSVWQAPKSNFS